MIVLWQIASLLAGQTYAGANMVPGLADILGATKLLGNYWPGGLGLEQTATGAPLTWRAALYAFFYNSGLTLLRMAGGLLLGVLAGVALAVLVSWSAPLRKMLSFPAHLARMLPLLALVPLFNLWLGNTEIAVVLFVAIVVFCVVFAATIEAIGAVPGYFTEYASSLGASRSRIYFTVILAAALPRIVVAVNLAHGFAWGGVIAAEFLGMQYGLGRIVLMAQQFNQFNLLALAAFITIVIAIISGAILSTLMSRAIRWSNE